VFRISFHVSRAIGSAVNDNTTVGMTELANGPVSFSLHGVFSFIVFRVAMGSVFLNAWGCLLHPHLRGRFSGQLIQLTTVVFLTRDGKIKEDIDVDGKTSASLNGCISLDDYRFATNILLIICRAWFSSGVSLPF
jgi:hypothetical protein